MGRLGWWTGLGWMALGAIPSSAAAQTPRGEVGLQAAVVGSDPAFVGAGALVSWRAAPQFRLGVTGLMGAQGGRLAGRTELTAAWEIDPIRSRGIRVFGGGGVATVIRSGRTDAYLVAVVGGESSPNAATGVRADLGIGGGFRVSLGLVRRFGKPRRR
jgi:hypothetical protein